MNVIKKFVAILCSVILAAVSVMPVMTASAIGHNLVPNPSVEANTSGKPTSWQTNKWGTNTASFTYANSGSQSGTYSVTTKMTARTSGDAKWFFSPVTVSPNTSYSYSNWYKSTARTSMVIEYTSSTNTKTYIWLGDLASSANVWKQANYTFKTPANVSKVTVFHLISTIGQITTDDYSLATTDSPAPAPAPTAPTPTAPTVSMTAPAGGSTISGSTNLSANAADAQAVSSVQFKVDGANVGAPDTTAPYSLAWDSKTVANGSRSFTAVATNASGLTTTSSSVTATVNNPVAPAPPPAPAPVPGNLVNNESVENGTSAPTGWTSNSWGTNTSVLSYETTGRTGTKSVKATMTSRTDGDAKWMFNSVPVTAGKTYSYSNWYKSNVTTELDAMVTMTNGTVQFYWLGTMPASPAAWSKASAQFAVPAGAASMTVFQVVYSVGYVQTDDFYLAEYAPQKFNRAIVSLNFDDSWRSVYTNGLPLMQKYGFVSTQYLNSQATIDGYPDYMTYQMVKDFAAAGHELGWHTRTHTDVTTMTAAQLNTELTIPTEFLNNIGQPASAFKNFATPYGSYNAGTVSEIMKKYSSHRSTDVGFNTKDNFNIQNMKVQNITNTTTPAQVKAWVDQAVAEGSWLVLLYHEVDDNPADTTYAVTKANFDAELNIIKQSGVAVKTMQQAIDELTAQL